MSPPLPEPIESELHRLLHGPEADFWPGVARLCRQHPDRAKHIRREAERLRTAGVGKRSAGSTQTKLPPRDEDAELKPGDRVGAFTVLEEIGHGGMGSVYLAEQKEPVRRRVALKVIKLGMDTRAVLARFEAERQALAMMDHSHIAKVLEAGVTPKGRPYFAMEHVKGVPLTRYCDENKLSLEARLLLFKQVCSGVQHAHTKGVIHRDLTANNVLVTVQDGKPVAKIIDFGLARATDQKLTEKTLFTEQGAILGTPEYMSPEQAGLSALDIDMRSDVYTLGVLLYELLTGRLPFEGRELRAQGYDAMYKTIREVDPPRPSTKVTTHPGGTDGAAKLRRTDASTLLKRLRGDLDWIVLKCLEKDRTRRYETVSGLADDVQRHLDHEPVLAHAPSAAYRLTKFARRYRGQLVAATAVLVALLVGLGIAIFFWLDAREQFGEARKQQSIAERNAADAMAREAEFDQLAGVVLYDRAIEAEKRLYPAWPHKIAAMENWLKDDAGRLLAMRGQIEQTVQDLRQRAEPTTPEEREHDRATHPKFGAWQKQAARLASLERAHAIRTKTLVLTLPLPTAEEQAMTPSQLNDLAWPRVDFDEGKRTWGEEARALTLAKLAWDKTEGLPAAARSQFGDTLAWAWFANGKDDEARAQSEAALALAPAEQKAEYESYLATLRTKVAAAQGEAGAKTLADLRTAVAALDAEVDTQQTFRFEDESQRFLHDTLSGLLTKLASLDAKERKAVEARLSWARRVSGLTLGHPNALETWKEARDSIAKADGVVASELYRGQRIELREQDVIGLVPIGMNPVTRLWEFYDLASAWDGVRDPASLAIPRHVTKGDDRGYIEVGDETGIVFVLLPGGSFTMGSQADDPNAPNYDPQREPDQTMHQVTLSPFFLARHELTQGQWKRLSGGETPSEFKAGAGNFVGGQIGWSNPVEQVDWHMCMRLVGRHGLTLPTEAQWEYGCRAGTTTAWSCALEDLVRYANVADATAKRATSWTCEEWSDDHLVHAPVGSFLPNAFGLFDVHGNVWEWTRDGAAGPGAKPRQGDGLRGDPGSAPARVNRGGSFSLTARDARSAVRSPNAPTIRDDSLGLRLARASRLID